ncbi:MAG: hypothetical protein WC301_05675 [Candidatus Omnitrophota bacterium]|jgi:hypothetical protein
MRFDEIKKEISGVAFDTLRADNEDYFEAVIENNKIGELTGSLEKVFGPPAWPSEKPIMPDTQGIIDTFGGIREGQTLYLRNDGKYSFFAMLWPWQDMQHTTVKISGKIS